MKLLAFSPRATVDDSFLVVQRMLQQECAESFDLMFTYDNPHPYVWREVYKNVELNYKKMRKSVLDGGYDKVWIVESDNIVPLHALSALLEVDAQVVTGLYPMRHGEPTPNLQKLGVTPGIGTAMSWEEVRRSKSDIIEVGGGCMGCLLLDRSIVEQCDFSMGKNNAAPDVPLMEWCCEKGVKQMARLDVQCGHTKANKDIIYPDLASQKGYRIEKAKR